MSVFDMLDLTPTRKPAAGVCKDREVPITNGVADGSRIGGPNFLSGITAGVSDSINNGVEQSIIYGDQVAEIKGKQAAKITGDRDTHVLGDLKMLVDGSEERWVRGMRTTEIGGQEYITIKADRFVTVIKNDSRNVYGIVFEHIVGGEISNEVNKKSEFYGVFRWGWGYADVKASVAANISLQSFKLDLQALKTDLTIIKSELKFVKGEGVGIHGELLGGAAKLGVVKLISGGVCNKLDLIGT